MKTGWNLRFGNRSRPRRGAGPPHRGRTGGIVLALCAALVLQTGSAASSGAPASSGTAGDDVRWALDTAGVLVIRGSGDMDDYVRPGQAPWYARRTQISRLRVEDAVTRIGNYTFIDLPNLEEAELGKAVETVGNYAFYNCVLLEKLSFGPHVRELGTGAFSHCGSLRDLALPAALETVGQSAFSACTSLDEADLPDSVKELKPYAFSECTRLRRVGLPDTLRSVGARAFENCAALSELALPGRVTSLGAGAFSGCASLRSLDLPAALDEIPGRAFADSGLESIRIPNAVKEIGAEAFGGCTALEYAVLSRSVTRIEDGAFQNCPRLRHVYYPGAQSKWDSILMNDFRSQVAWQGVEVHIQSSGPEESGGSTGGEPGGGTDSGTGGGTGGGTDGDTGGETGGGTDSGTGGVTSVGTVYINSVLPDAAGGTVRVEVSGVPGADSVLAAAAYAPDGRMLRVRLQKIRTGGTYLFAMPVEDAGSVTAFLLDSRSRPIAGHVRYEAAG
ncbi:MAG: leucine-rich repeat domain-containing protein [Oscillibacter sp.]|nr:leucine-rich repeat domain-containing protein [Oscillibacter sp.]